MADAFVGEIRMFGFNFAPTGWATCDGQLLPISQNTALFSLLGTFYGGDGKSTFALPNLDGSSPVHFGQGPGLSPYDLGQQGGQETVTLISTEMPAHNHGPATASSASADQLSPAGNVWAVGGGRRAAVNMYTAAAGSSPIMNPVALSITGGSLPHNNMPP